MRTRTSSKQSRPDARSLAGLKELQRLMASAVMRPLTPSHRTRPRWLDGKRATSKAVSEFIKPNDRLTSFERLEIYNRQYWFRLWDCIRDDFPGLRAVMGQKKFTAMTTEYLHLCPSHSYTLRNLGSNLETFLRKKPKWTRPYTRLVMDMVRFEWAQVVAFDGPADPALTIDGLLGADPAKLKLGLQPYITLLEMDYPLDDFVIALKRSDASRTDASNAASADPTASTRPKSKASLPKPQKTYLAVHRLNLAVYYKQLEPAAFAILAAIRDGMSLAKACEKALLSTRNRPTRSQKKSKKTTSNKMIQTSNEVTVAMIQKWFRNWASMGWFCARGRKG